MEVLQNHDFAFQLGACLETQTVELTTQDRLLRIGSVILLVAYAWIMAKALEPRFPLPASLVAGAGWIEGGELKTWRQVKAHRFQEVARLASAIERSESAIRALGGLKTPVPLIINVDQPERYSITDQQIEIGTGIFAGVDGQIEKAFVKVWLYQKGPASVVSSLMRLEVVSDALVAMLTSQRSALPIQAVKHWIHSASSYQVLCQKPWKSRELQGFCGESEAMSALAFRPLMTSVIVSLHDELSPIQRLDFARSWIQALSENQTAPKNVPDKLDDWRGWIDDELQALIPSKLHAEFEQVSPLLELLRSKAGLVPGSSIPVSAVFFGQELATAAHTHSTIVVTDDKRTLLPGRVELSTNDLNQVKAQWAVWESCETPTLEMVFSRKIQAERILYVQTCGLSAEQINSARQALLRGGIEQLAADAPKVPFVLLKADMIELAVKWQEVNPKLSLHHYIANRNAVPLLGLETAQWNTKLKAFRVNGAIEAIEWFRSLSTL